MSRVPLQSRPQPHCLSPVNDSCVRCSQHDSCLGVPPAVMLDGLGSLAPSGTEGVFSPATPISNRTSLRPREWRKHLSLSLWVFFWTPSASQVVPSPWDESLAEPSLPSSTAFRSFTPKSGYVGCLDDVNASVRPLPLRFPPVLSFQPYTSRALKTALCDTKLAPKCAITWSGDNVFLGSFLFELTSQ